MAWLYPYLYPAGDLRGVQVVYPDRSVRVVYPDRSVRVVYPDRSVRVVYPDRSVGVVSPATAGLFVGIALSNK